MRLACGSWRVGSRGQAAGFLGGYIGGGCLDYQVNVSTNCLVSGSGSRSLSCHMGVFQTRLSSLLTKLALVQEFRTGCGFGTVSAKDSLLVSVVCLCRAACSCTCRVYGTWNKDFRQSTSLCVITVSGRFPFCVYVCSDFVLSAFVRFHVLLCVRFLVDGQPGMYVERAMAHCLATIFLLCPLVLKVPCSPKDV